MVSLKMHWKWFCNKNVLEMILPEKCIRNRIIKNDSNIKSIAKVLL